MRLQSKGKVNLLGSRDQSLTDQPFWIVAAETSAGEVFAGF